MSAVRALLHGLIDYAGLFPPAALEMGAAVRQYAEHRSGRFSFMMGRFVVPLKRLDEMRKAAAAISGSAAWKPSVLALAGDALPPEIDSVEIQIERAADIRRVGAAGPLVRYLEIPIGSDPREFVAALAETGARAKVRTGGATPEAYPSVGDLARFVCDCAAARVPFKATAGLHHAIAAPPAHGFLNLFLAAALAYHGGSPKQVAATLEETSGAVFQHENGGIAWHRHRLTLKQIVAARSEFAIGFGSCSFEEPVADLEALGWL